MAPETICDLFAGLGPIRTRKMFGGQGVYRADLMFALEAYGELYLKTDEASLEAFRTAGSRPFVYEKDGRRTQTSYWLIPDAALDDPDEAARWGRLALEAASPVARRGPAKRRPRSRETWAATFDP